MSKTFAQYCIITYLQEVNKTFLFLNLKISCQNEVNAQDAI